MSDEISETRLDQLDKSLDGISSQFKIFSNAIRQLYYECNVGEKEQAAASFRELRDETRTDAECYMRGALPIMEQFVQGMQNFFENYSELTFDEWHELLNEILLAAQEMEELGKVVARQHESIMVELKKRQSKINESLKTLRDLTEKYYKKQKEVALANSFLKRTMSYYFPIAYTTYLVLFQPKRKTAEEVALQAKADCAKTAADLVDDEIRPALYFFIEGVKQCAGFFNILYKELQNEKNNLVKVQNPEARNSLLRLHYKKMRGKSRLIISSCRKFYWMIPDVRTDFQSIPKEGIDENYIERWLREQKEMIENECHPTLAERLVNSIFEIGANLIPSIPVASFVSSTISNISSAFRHDPPPELHQHHDPPPRDGQENSALNSMNYVLQ